MITQKQRRVEEAAREQIRETARQLAKVSAGKAIINTSATVIELMHEAKVAFIAAYEVYVPSKKFGTDFFEAFLREYLSEICFRASQTDEYKAYTEAHK